MLCDIVDKKESQTGLKIVNLQKFTGITYTKISFRTSNIEDE